MSNAKRVYHPTLNSWQDVPEADVETWAKQGWLKTKPKHADTSEALPVGESFIATVAPDVVDEPAPEGK